MVVAITGLMLLAINIEGVDQRFRHPEIPDRGSCNPGAVSEYLEVRAGPFFLPRPARRGYPSGAGPDGQRGLADG